MAPSSGGEGVGSECPWVGGVAVGRAGAVERVSPFDRPYRLGVMVCASDSIEESDGCRRAARTGDALGERDWDGVDIREMRTGDERADSKVSKMEEVGVWYTDKVCVVVIVPTVLPLKRVDRLRDRDVFRRGWYTPMSMECVRGGDGVKMLNVTEDSLLVRVS